MTTTFDSYTAHANAQRATTLAATSSPFSIQVRFLQGLTPTQQAAFSLAADRWTTVIVGDLPSVEVDGEIIDDVLILAEGVEIDGPGMVLGKAGPTHVRPEGAGAASLLPAKGIMRFDVADLAAMEQRHTLNDVITHEMGHVLGIGTMWPAKGLLTGADTDDPTFSGSGAVREYAALRSDRGHVEVPVENTGGPGTRGGHWRESVFRTELMTGFVGVAGNPMSRMTVASLADLGYEVDLDAAQPYQLPVVLEAEMAAVEAGGHACGELVLPVVPVVLPAGSLR